MGRISVNYENLECTSGTAPYKLYNVGGATAARVYSYEDNNQVWLNNSFLGSIDKQEGLEFNLALGDVLKSCYPIAASGEDGDAGIELQPFWTMSDRQGTNYSRGGGVDLNIYSIDATSVNIYRNHALVTTLAVVPNQVTTFTQAGNYVGSWIVEGVDGCIMAFHREDNAGTNDPEPMTALSNDISGWASTAAYISSDIGGTGFDSYSNLGNYSSTIATTYNIINATDLPNTTAQDDFFDPRVSLRVITTGVDLYGSSRADSDGGDSAAFFPTSWLKTRHLIPQPTEFISVLNYSGATIDVYDENGVLTTITPTKTNTDALAPYAFRIGTPDGTTNQNAGYLLESTDPLMVVYQPKGAGNFGSDDDELNSFGIS